MADMSTLLLQALGPWRNAKAWHVALSGGLDSTVLLHLLVQLRKTHSLPPITAVHVHHGLQAAADAWPAHCQALCKGLGVPLQVIAVQVQAGASVERAARDARYQAFTAISGAGEVLLLGQHRDDQAETLLFRLLRGAGVSGLAGMPRQRRLGAGHLCRPLLDVSRAQLESYARAQGLSWIEDPSNSQTDFSRNFLRHEVLPVLARRWPQAAGTDRHRQPVTCPSAQCLASLAVSLHVIAGHRPLGGVGCPAGCPHRCAAGVEARRRRVASCRWTYLVAGRRMVAPTDRPGVVALS